VGGHNVLDLAPARVFADHLVGRRVNLPHVP
jgi:hypothetical protein